MGVTKTLKLHNINKIQSISIDLDELKCVKCGKTELIQYEEVGRTFDCHHINGNVLDNRNSNLETVCSKCHKPIHPNRTWKRFSGEHDNGGEKSIE